MVLEDQFCRVKQCCCGCELKIGVQILAALSVLASLNSLLRPSYGWLEYTGYILATGQAIAGVLGFTGAMNSDVSQLMVFFHWGLFHWFLNLILCVVAILVAEILCEDNYMSKFAVCESAVYQSAGFAFVLHVVIGGYSQAVVASLVMMIKQQRVAGVQVNGLPVAIAVATPVQVHVQSSGPPMAQPEGAQLAHVQPVAAVASQMGVTAPSQAAYAVAPESGEPQT